MVSLLEWRVHSATNNQLLYNVQKKNLILYYPKYAFNVLSLIFFKFLIFECECEKDSDVFAGFLQIYTPSLQITNL